MLAGPAVHLAVMVDQVRTRGASRTDDHGQSRAARNGPHADDLAGKKRAEDTAGPVVGALLNTVFAGNVFPDQGRFKDGQ